MTYAPIILFVYNRLSHTKRTVEALAKNVLASESDLMIFADGPKEGASEEQKKKIKDVREYLHTISGFKSIVIHESPANKGLAASIIEGVTNTVNQYGKVIVIEDDMVTSRYFLTYMNQSLDLYENCEQVVCINGYSIIKDAPITDRTYFQYGADCWGWATWKRAWKIFNPDAQYLMNAIKGNRTSKLLFTYNGSYPYMGMLQNQIDGVIDSWAVRWYASAVVNRKLCLYPAKSLVQNIGFDEGTHCSPSDVYEASVLADESVSDFPLIEVRDSAIMRKEWERLFRVIHRVPLSDRWHAWKKTQKRKLKSVLRKVHILK